MVEHEMAERKHLAEMLCDRTTGLTDARCKVPVSGDDLPQVATGASPETANPVKQKCQSPAPSHNLA